MKLESLLAGEIKPMNPEAKTLWIKALRSGKYVKICGDMRNICATENKEGYECWRADMNSKEMCVMGVLADVALLNSGLKYTADNYDKFSTGEMPTLKTLRWANLSREVVDALVADNDSRKMTFKEFARWIRKNL